MCLSGNLALDGTINPLGHGGLDPTGLRSFSYIYNSDDDASPNGASSSSSEAGRASLLERMRESFQRVVDAGVDVCAFVTSSFVPAATDTTAQPTSGLCAGLHRRVRTRRHAEPELSRGPTPACTEE